MHPTAPTVIKVCIRALASIGAFLGLSMLGFGLALHLPSAIASGESFLIAFSAFGVIVGTYLCYVGFVAWFRFSPEVVRLVLGFLAMMLFGIICSTWNRLRSAGSPVPFDLAVLFAGLITYILYRCLVYYCCKHLFPPQTHDADRIV